MALASLPESQREALATEGTKSPPRFHGELTSREDGTTRPTS